MLAITVISAGMWIAYSVGDGTYGVAVVAAALLSIAGIVVAVDSYGATTFTTALVAMPYACRGDLAYRLAHELGDQARDRPPCW